MPKATSVTPGTAAPPARRAASRERNADKVVESARKEADRVRAAAAADAKRTRAEAEEHARRLILDARATADGVRAEGMEVVSNLRQISETLREMSERVLADIEAIHRRMVGELGEALPTDAAVPVPTPPPKPGDAAPPHGAGSHDELDVPDFLSHG